LINSDVQLFWANDENGDITIIFDMVEEDRNNKYTCPVCGSEVRPVAIDNKTKTGKVAQVSSHFSHFDASKCSNESAIHYWFKNKILVNGDSFIIKTDIENEYKCKEVLIEQFYRTEFGIYRPDITIITECGKSIYFEMNYTNKKKVEDYMDKWLELGNPVVEVDLKALMSASLNKTKYEFKALFYEGKCFNTKKNDLYYDTVGQFKERICKNNIIDNEIRERIKKLDWFWMETINYKRGETNIEQLTNYIDYAEQDEKDLIFMILSKKRCVPIYEDYINYKVDLFEKLSKTIIIDFKDTKYNKYFLISKKKISRKNKKNIEYDVINFKIAHSFGIELNLNVDKYSKNEFLFLLKTNIDNFIDIEPYYDKSCEICLLVEDIYQGKYKGDLGIKIYNGSYDTYVKSVNISKYYMYSHQAHMGSELYIYKNSIKFENKELKLDILKEENKDTIINFISEFIDIKIEERKQELIKEEEMKREKLINEINKEHNEFNLILSKITDIFDKNKDKIIFHKIDYVLDDKFINLLYFKDYRGIEFIIHGRWGFLHEKSPVAKNYYNAFYNYQGNCKLIKINDLSLGKNIYITETEDSYEIDTYINKPTYKFPTYLNNPDINLSFRDMGFNTKHLLRYDFLNTANKINEILKNKVSDFKSNFLTKYYKNYSNEIYCAEKITDEEINKEIHKLLYPIVYLGDKFPNSSLNIRLNIDFATEYNEKKPWYIKTFIEALRDVGIKNIHNII